MDDPEQPESRVGCRVELIIRDVQHTTERAVATVTRPLRDRIRRAAVQSGVRLDYVEKDYALSYVLAGIAAQPELAETLVFKGGTALKKAYFGDYRFSEDLDFSTRGAPRGPDMDEAFRAVTTAAQELLRQHGPFEVQTERMTLKKPHPGGQDAFYVRVHFPWHRALSGSNPKPACRVKVEITHDEPVLLEPEWRRVLHGYEEALEAAVCCYRIEEVVAEKLRSLLQTHTTLVSQGWNRPRARDYYDLWRVLTAFGETLDRSCLPELLARKCAHRGVSFQSLDDFFTETLLSEARKHWKTNLTTFVAGAPDCDAVIDRLRGDLPNYFPSLSRRERPESAAR